MKASNIISGVLVVIIVATIVIATVVKVSTNHRNDLLRVVNQSIAEAGEKCVIEGKCTEEEFTLNTLIQNGYIEPQIHPITKEYISESTKITCSNYDCTSSVK